MIRDNITPIMRFDYTYNVINNIITYDIVRSDITITVTTIIIQQCNYPVKCTLPAVIITVTKVFCSMIIQVCTFDTRQLKVHYTRERDSEAISELRELVPSSREAKACNPSASDKRLAISLTQKIGTASHGEAARGDEIACPSE